MAKEALKLVVLLVLLAGGVSLFFSKDVGRYIQEWKNRGANEARVSMPPPANTNNAQISNTGSAEQAGITPPDLGSIFGLNGQNASRENDGSNSFNATASNNGAENNANSTISASALDNASGMDGVEVKTESGQAARVGGVAPPLHEDMVVSRRFIYDLASSLVNAYYPASVSANSQINPGVGYSTLNLRFLNVNYGAETRRFFKKGRLETLQYIMAPSMLEALYSLYIDDFMAAMQTAANNNEKELNGKLRALTKPEQREMYAYYAKQAAGIAAVFEATVASPAIAQKLDAYYEAAVQALQKNNAFMEATQAKQENANSKAASSAYNQAAKAYQNSVQKREQARATLLTALQRYPGVRNLDDANVVYAAAWINRRLADGSAENASISIAARIFNNLASRLRLASQQAG